MKLSTQSLCEMVSFPILALMVSACQCSAPTPQAPREPPNHSVQWLSKKANSAADADDYYRSIGAISALPGGGERRETLNDFKKRNGFDINDGHLIEATYYNEADLRFGRNMNCRWRQKDSSVIACYVVNHGPPPFARGRSNPDWPNQLESLRDAVAKANPFATVAMEARDVPERTVVTVAERHGSPLQTNTHNPFVNSGPNRDVETVYIRPGESVTVTATGSIWSGILADPGNDADGKKDGATNEKFPLPESAPFALIGSINGGVTYFEIGTAKTITNKRKETRLLVLRTNDDVPGNGSGQFRVEITRLNRVSFFTYDPSGALISAAALDSEDVKPTPGICLACHGGRLDKTSKPGSVVVVGATFLPFDVRTFGFSEDVGSGLQDQQEAFRKLNQLVVNSRPNEANSNRPIVSFINSLY